MTVQQLPKQKAYITKEEFKKVRQASIGSSLKSEWYRNQHGTEI